MTIIIGKMPKCKLVGLLDVVYHSHKIARKLRKFFPFL